MIHRAIQQVLAAALLMAAGAAAADELKLISPNEIDYHELEIEHEGSAAFDPNHRRDGGRSLSADLATGLTPWWHVGVELDTEREAGPHGETALQGVQLESMIRLTRPGENWADVALYTEFTRSVQRSDVPDAILVGGAFLKDIGRITTILDLYVEKAFSSDDDYNGIRFSYALQSRWNLYRQFAPSIEAFGQAGRIDRPNSFETGQLSAGPVATGTFLLGPIGKLRYEAGYLFGLTDASPAGTIRWRLELQIPI